ncbi:MAG: alpha/beta fold hydrolase [Lachnospiraceae bacterium]|nr:alpha/beta fold hydrolase [Lachnospiraceae bacterium]
MGKNGKKIAVKIYLPLREEHKYPAVIFSHGFGGNYRCLEHHGETIAGRGIICFFFDFCGGGMESLSDGNMQEMTVMTEVSDLLEMYEYVSSREYVDANNIFLIGESQGGFVSAYVAAILKEKIKSLILWYPAFVIPDDSVKRLACGDNKVFGIELSPEYDKAAARIDIYAKIKDYSGPVYIIHGDLDDVVPIEYSIRANDTYANSDLLTIHGAGHGFEGQDSVMVIEKSIDFIIKCH